MQINLLAPRTQLSSKSEHKGPGLKESWLLSAAAVFLLAWLALTGWQSYRLGQAVAKEKMELQRIQSQVEQQNRVLRLARRIEVQQRVWRELESQPTNWQGALARLEGYGGTELQLTRIKFGPGATDWLFQGESASMQAIEAFQARLEQDKDWRSALLAELQRNGDTGRYAFTISQGGGGK